MHSRKHNTFNSLTRPARGLPLSKASIEASFSPEDKQTYTLLKAHENTNIPAISGTVFLIGLATCLFLPFSIPVVAAALTVLAISATTWVHYSRIRHHAIKAQDYMIDRQAEKLAREPSRVTHTHSSRKNSYSALIQELGGIRKRCPASRMRTSDDELVSRNHSATAQPAIVPDMDVQATSYRLSPRS